MRPGGKSQSQRRRFVVLLTPNQSKIMLKCITVSRIALSKHSSHYMYRPSFMLIESGHVGRRVVVRIGWNERIADWWPFVACTLVEAMLTRSKVSIDGRIRITTTRVVVVFVPTTEQIRVLGDDGLLCTTSSSWTIIILSGYRADDSCDDSTYYHQKNDNSDYDDSNNPWSHTIGSRRRFGL